MNYITSLRHLPKRQQYDFSNPEKFLSMVRLRELFYCSLFFFFLRKFKEVISLLVKTYFLSSTSTVFLGLKLSLKHADTQAHHQQ